MQQWSYFSTTRILGGGGRITCHLFLTWFRCFGGIHLGNSHAAHIRRVFSYALFCIAVTKLVFISMAYFPCLKYLLSHDSEFLETKMRVSSLHRCNYHDCTGILFFARFKLEQWELWIAKVCNKSAII